MNNIWKYLEQIPTINKDKFEQRLLILYRQYYSALRIRKIYKNDEATMRKEIGKLKLGQTMLGYNLSVKKKSANIGFAGTYKDGFDQVHVIQFNGIYFYRKPIQYLRSLCQKRIGAACKSIVVDNDSIIDKHGNFVEPLYMQRQRNFVKEVGLSNDNN